MDAVAGVIPLPAIERKYNLPKNKVSFSSLRMFNQCAECWMRQYLENEPGRVSIALPFGVSVHEGLAEARRQQIGDQSFGGDPAEVAADVFEHEIEEIDPALLDLGATGYSDPLKAKDDVVRLVQHGIDHILPHEVGRILEVECRPDFGSLFGFTVDGYIDVMLRSESGGILLKDLKTAKDKREPDVWGKIQLRLYSLPWFLAEQSVDLQLDTLTKQKPSAYIPTAVEGTSAQYMATYEWVLKTAGAISSAMESGDFPASPSWFCKYPHALSLSA